MELYSINEEHYLFLSLRIIKVDHCLKESPAHRSIVLGEGGGGGVTTYFEKFGRSQRNLKKKLYYSSLYFSCLKNLKIMINLENKPISINGFSTILLIVRVFVNVLK